LFTANIRIMAVHFPLDNIKFPPIPNQEIEKYTRYTSIPVHNYKYVLYPNTSLSNNELCVWRYTLLEWYPTVTKMRPYFHTGLRECFIHWHERTGIAEVRLTWQSMILNHMLKLASTSHLVIVVHYGVVVYNTIFNDISAWIHTYYSKTYRHQTLNETESSINRTCDKVLMFIILLIEAVISIPCLFRTQKMFTINIQWDRYWRL
jgi:hypothetical protein